MNKITTPVKNFVRRNKRALVVGAALGTVVVLQNRGIAGLNEFLKEKGLFEEYYLPIKNEV